MLGSQHMQKFRDHHLNGIHRWLLARIYVRINICTCHVTLQLHISEQYALITIADMYDFELKPLLSIYFIRATLILLIVHRLCHHKYS